MKAKLTQAAMAAMIAARGTSEHRPLVKRLFAEAKAHYGIPTKHRLRADIDNADSADYGVLIRKRNGQAYEVMADLVPVYKFAKDYVAVPLDEAVEAIKQAAIDHGAVLEAGVVTGAPCAADLQGITAYGDYLYVTEGDKVHRLAVEEATYVLAMLSDGQIVGQFMPDGYGDLLMANSQMLIPA